MFRVIFLGFLVFAAFCVVAPTSVYAISLDDEEEDAEDVADMLDQAQKAGKSEKFDKADTLLKKAKMYGVKTDKTKETEKLIASKKAAKAERERKERERLARIKREKEERARQARLAAQRRNSYNASSYAGGSIKMCIPAIPYKCCEYYECRAKTASGRYENATIRLTKDSVGDCYTLGIVGGNGYGGGSTCSGVNGSWAVQANGHSGFANNLSYAIAWLLRRM